MTSSEVRADVLRRDNAQVHLLGMPHQQGLAPPWVFDRATCSAEGASRSVSRIYPFPSMYFGVGWPHRSPPGGRDPVRPQGLEVGELSYWDLNGLAGQQLANMLCDVLAVLSWVLVAGVVASGACWYVGQFIHDEWVREHPPPSFGFLAERRLRSEVARGFADLEDYLHELDPTHANDGPARSRRSRTRRRRQGWRRP